MQVQEFPVNKLILVTGGARSGKSSFAEKLAAHLGDSGTYVATCETLDEEMERRVGLHRERREEGRFPWQTIEEPFELAAVLEKAATVGAVVLVDCLTLWLSNWLLRYEAMPDAEARVNQEIDKLVDALQHLDGTVIMVTNEVGDGLVPEYPLGRLYRDLAGRMNQRITAICGQVFLVTVGIPVELKALEYKLD